MFVPLAFLTCPSFIAVVVVVVCTRRCQFVAKTFQVCRTNITQLPDCRFIRYIFGGYTFIKNTFFQISEIFLMNIAHKYYYSNFKTAISSRLFVKVWLGLKSTLNRLHVTCLLGTVFSTACYDDIFFKIVEMEQYHTLMDYRPSF